jgi:hypothetical protein
VKYWPAILVSLQSKEIDVTYRVIGLDPEPFRPLFALSDDELRARGMRRMTVTKKPSFPCRVSLTDRDIGEEVILLNHVSHDVANPYRASHAIFVSDSGRAQFVDEVPPVFGPRILSHRGFDNSGMMVDALISQPGEADPAIRKLFDNPEIVAIHAHNAARGCFAAKIERN